MSNETTAVAATAPACSRPDTWTARLDAIDDAPFFDAADRLFEEAANLAGSWHTCAVGERLNLPEGADEDWVPTAALRRLGYAFASALAGGSTGKAREALAEIRRQADALPPELRPAY